LRFARSADGHIFQTEIFLQSLDRLSVEAIDAPLACDGVDQRDFRQATVVTADRLEEDHLLAVLEALEGLDVGRPVAEKPVDLASGRIAFYRSRLRDLELAHS